MKRVVRVVVWGAVGLIALFAVLALTVGIGFYRLVPINNDPLTNSVAVESIAGDRLTLADGRVIVMQSHTSVDLEWDIQHSEGRIELDTDGDAASVYIKKKRFICGFGLPLVVIPIMRTEYPAFERRWLGLGLLEREQTSQ